MTHTATPWITCDDEDSCAGLILIGPPVFDDLVTNPVVKTYNYDDAEFIVRACNSHDRLVQELSGIVAFADGFTCYHSDGVLGKALSQYIEGARSALLELKS